MAATKIVPSSDQPKTSSASRECEFRDAPSFAAGLAVAYAVGGCGRHGSAGHRADRLSKKLCSQPI
jgi:hypothetical protein